MRVLLIAEKMSDVSAINDLLQEQGHDVAFVQNGIEGNDVVLNGLARRLPFDLIFLHHFLDDSDTRELIRYWRSQDPFLPLVMIGPESILKDQVLFGLGLIDCIPENVASELLFNKLSHLDRASTQGATYRLKSELLEGPALGRDPLKATQVAIQLLKQQTLSRAAVFISYTADPDDPIVQITDGLEMYDQVWVDEFCESAMETIEPVLRAGRWRKVEEDPPHFIFPISTSYGWEGVLLFFVDDHLDDSHDRRQQDQFQTLADGFRAMLEHVRIGEKVEVLHTQKLEYMNILSNKFRIPLSNLTTAVDLLAMVEAEDNIKHLANRIRQACLETQKLLEDTLELARIDDGMLVIHPGQVSLKRLLLKMIEKNEALFLDKDLKVNLEYAADEPYIVEGDPQKLERVFANLFSNAAKFSPQNGEIKVILHLEANGWVRTTISDQGPGISPDRFESIFERTSGDADVLSEQGVGLYICNKFIQAHEGQIWVESEPGKGAKFLVRLRPSMFVSGDQSQL